MAKKAKAADKKVAKKAVKKAEVREIGMTVRLTKKEHTAIKKSAKEAKKSLSEYMRDKALM
jgi:predicted HicB family RNase H-like nuclease